MSQSVSSSTTAATFVVRFWRETTASGTRWRGSIEHVPSGEQAAFLEIDAMLSFLRRFGVTLQDQNRPTKAVQLRRTS